MPRIYCGVWQRALLEGDGLTTDRNSTVLWLQTPVWHGDLRLPSPRPNFSEAIRFNDCTSTQIRWLALQQGFSGITQVSDDKCQWLRDVDFQPHRGSRDVGRMVFIENSRVLEEYGVEADYHETWIRLPEGDGPCACWERKNLKTHGIERLLIAGDCFFLVKDRASSLPKPDNGRYPNLCNLIFQRADKASVWLDLTLAFGRIDCGPRPWQIAHATLPWLEGRSLADLGLGAHSEWTAQLQETGAPVPPFKAD
ncbi:MAG TPA: hypothetical protein VFW68_07115 [Rhodocyclaceae bacterium]|nr:hypothetical protein [Rhodocyclaceae bacterium]